MEWGAGNRDASECLESELTATVGLWEEAASKGEARFYADSAPSAGKFLNLLDRRGWDWSVSYNKWTSKLDTIAAQMKEEEWSAPEGGVDRQGKPVLQQYGWIKHLPGEGWWRLFLDHHYPKRKRKRGRPPNRPGPIEMQAVRA